MTLTHKTGRMNRKRHSEHDWLLYCGMNAVIAIGFGTGAAGQIIAKHYPTGGILGLCAVLATLLAIGSFRIWKRSNR